MKGYLSVLKLLFKNMLKKSGKDGKGIRIFSAVMLGILYVSVAAFLVYMITAISSIVTQHNMQSEILTIVFAVCCVAILFLGIIGILNSLYFSRDTEFFLSLPIKTSTVYFAKMTVVYATTLVIEALIMLPCIIAMGVMMQMSAIFYIVCLIVILTLPALPIMLASIIAIPLMYIVSFFKNKGALTSIVLIVIFGLFFLGYYLVIMNFSNSMANGGDVVDINELFLKFKDAFVTVSNILLPLSAAAKLATLTPVYGLGAGLSSLVNAVTYIAFMAALTVIALLISSAVYKRGAAAMLEGARNTKVEKRDYKASGSAIKALFLKEWRQLVRTPAFAFQCLSSLILTPIIVVVMSISMGGASEMGEGAEMLGMMSGLMNIFMIMMIGVGINSGACTAITREGETFYYNKVLPVDYSDQIKAKKLLYLAISYAAITLSIVLAMVFSKSIWLPLIGFGFFIPYNYAFVNFALYFDLNSPRLKWTTPNEAVKNNKSAMVPMFINMGISMVLMFVSIGISTANIDVEGQLTQSGQLGLVILFAALYVVGIALAVICHKLLHKNVTRLYERIEI